MALRSAAAGADRPVRRGRKALLSLLLTLAVAIGYFPLRDTPVMESIEGQTLDWRFQLRGPQPPPDSIAVLAIDEKSLAALGRWPVSRARLAEAVERVMAAGATAVVFDLLLTGAEAGADGPADRPGAADLRLARAIAAASSRVVVPFAFVFDAEHANVEGLPPRIERAALPVVRRPAGVDGGGQPRPFGLLTPLPALREAARTGHVNVFLDSDGQLRGSYPVLAYGNHFFPSAPLVAAMLALDLAPDRVMVRVGEGFALGEQEIATGPSLRLPINFYGPRGSFDTYSLVDLLEGSLPPETFRDRVVFIGAHAVGLGDNFGTPFTPALPGVEVFATVAANLMTGDIVRRSALTELASFGAVLLFGLLAAGLWWLRSPVVALAGAAGLFGVWCAVCILAFLNAGIWLTFSFAALTIALVGGALLVERTATEFRLRRSAEAERGRLARYVSPLAAARQGPGDDGERVRQAAVMFVDMVGFTRRSEDLAPGETLALVRRFHGMVAACAEAHRGIVDKFIGDGALIVFGFPQAGPNDAADALACARDLVVRVDDWNGKEDPASNPIDLGIGIHFGPVALGEIGGARQSQVTVMGDVVNLASRLQSITREQGTRIIASDAAMESARAAGGSRAQDGFERLPMLEVRGRERPVGAWAWRGSATASADEGAEENAR